MASGKQKQVIIDYVENKEFDYKIKFSVLKVLVIVLAVFLAVIWLKSFFTLEVVLDEETQSRLDKDTEHAVDDAKKYLDEKYNMEYELNTFEPIIYALSSETSWDRTHYDGNWRGKFTIDGVSYKIGKRPQDWKKILKNQDFILWKAYNQAKRLMENGKMHIDIITNLI